LKNKTAS